MSSGEGRRTSVASTRLVLILLASLLQLVESNVESLGCFKDRELRDLPVWPQNVVNLTNCIDRCEQLHYLYAGVQRGDQCFCGNTYGLYGPAVGDCNSTCFGDANQSDCGGDMRNSIYRLLDVQPGTEALGMVEYAATLKPPSAEYIGCFAISALDLSNQVAADGFSACLTQCMNDNYLYAGVRGSDCFCGDAYGTYAQLENTRCFAPCFGDPQLLHCGAVNEYTVYQVQVNPMEELNVQDPGYRGCFLTDIDAEMPSLMSQARNFSDCIGQCLANGFDYAGFQPPVATPVMGQTMLNESATGMVCHCGNSYSSTMQVDDDECTSRCFADDNLRKCGGPFRSAIYATSGYVVYDGCYNDYAMPDLAVEIRWTHNVSECLTECLWLQYMYGGVRNGDECFCGNHVGSYGRADEYECVTPCYGDISQETCGHASTIAVYRMADIKINFEAYEPLEYASALKPDAKEYMGCFVESVAELQLTLNATSFTDCLWQCANSSHSYAGLRGSECRCGGSYGSKGQKEDTDCSLPCFGDRSFLHCGDDNAFTVYRVNAVPNEVLAISDAAFIGCYFDYGNTSTLAEANATSLAACIARCSTAGYTVAAVKAVVETDDSHSNASAKGSQCFCGTAYQQLTRLSDSDCNGYCYLNDTQRKCGGTHRLAVYRLIECDLPPAVNGLSFVAISSSELSPGVVATYECPAGQEVASGVNTLTITCLQSGMWSAVQGTCYTPTTQASAVTSAHVDACASSPCMHGGTCHSSAGGYTCNCTASYIGAVCDEMMLGDCPTNVCLHNARCYVTPDNPTFCDCPPGYAGAVCGTDIDECASSPCMYGVCHDAVGEFTCTCNAGYTGTMCDWEVVDDACASNPCMHDGTCYTYAGGYSCTCADTYVGQRCEAITLGNCPTNVCLHDANCYVTPDNPTFCDCPLGYAGADCGIDVDECASSPCVHGVCHDAVGEFTCTCDEGYTGTMCDWETGADACASNPCMYDGTCYSYSYGYSCTCTDTYVGQRCEVMTLGDCPTNVCLHDANCYVTTNNPTFCDCLLGYAGADCGIDIDECASSPCMHGVCHDAVAEFTCTCAVGYTGTMCDWETVADACASNPCMHDGTCRSSTGGYSCTCAASYAGQRCEEMTLGACPTNICKNNAKCYVTTNNPTFCDCPLGYAGADCGTDINECASSPCMHGTCHDAVGMFSCSCDAGYVGVECDSEIDECTSLPCQGGGTCHDLVNQFQCSCVQGRSGDMCEIIGADECASVPCQNSGHCVDGLDKYDCSCSAEYEGTNCEKKKPTTTTTTVAAGGGGGGGGTAAGGTTSTTGSTGHNAAANLHANAAASTLSAAVIFMLVADLALP